MDMAAYRLVESIVQSHWYFNKRILQFIKLKVFAYQHWTTKFNSLGDLRETMLLHRSGVAVLFMVHLQTAYSFFFPNELM